MGRKKINTGDLKCKISVTISPEINNKLDGLSINKSKLINKLLVEYFKKNSGNE